MMVFNVQLLYISINFLMVVMSFDCSCKSHHCCDDCCLSVCITMVQNRYQFFKRLL